MVPTSVATILTFLLGFDTILGKVLILNTIFKTSKRRMYVDQVRRLPPILPRWDGAQWEGSE